MRRTCLTITGMCLMILHAFSQGSPKDTSTYKSRPLKLDEVEFVSSYYDQTADKSAVQEVLLNTGNGRCFVIGP